MRRIGYSSSSGCFSSSMVYFFDRAVFQHAYSSNMELYFKDLISKEESLEDLVENLMKVVQGAEEFAESNGANLKGSKEELINRLARLKEHCHRLSEYAVGRARAADKVMRRHPYSNLGFAFAAGLVVGILVARSRESDAD